MLSSIPELCQIDIKRGGEKQMILMLMVALGLSDWVKSSWFISNLIQPTLHCQIKCLIWACPDWCLYFTLIGKKHNVFAYTSIYPSIYLRSSICVPLTALYMSDRCHLRDCDLYAWDRAVWWNSVCRGVLPLRFALLHLTALPRFVRWHQQMTDKRASPLQTDLPPSVEGRGA